MPERFIIEILFYLETLSHGLQTQVPMGAIQHNKKWLGTYGDMASLSWWRWQQLLNE